ncbi:unnamed protein product [Orchesella dallaii]|uniref:Nuclear receptor coactivator 5 n=1 Tax=Orchesella dallaii TaxID=48710 RepID=A0ABP1QZR4_9HEXA
MSYSYGGPAPMGRGRGASAYGPPLGHDPYYAPPGPRGGGRGHMQSAPGYMPHSDYDSSPMNMMPRGPSYGEHGSFGRGYPGNSPHAPLHPGGRGGPGNNQTRPGSGFESSSNSDDPRASGPSGGKSAFANDCEIIVLHKTQQQYGEMVENQLRAQGLSVDMMFPKADVNISEFLAPCAKRGLIFAVIISDENELARNLNFYQFRGLAKPQFHKNVPLAMAVTLIKRKYDELQDKEIGFVPENIKQLLGRTMNNKKLNNLEYTAVIKFFQERKNRQNAFLNRTSNVIQDHRNDISSLVDSAEGKELQKRIQDMLHEMRRSGGDKDESGKTS